MPSEPESRLTEKDEQRLKELDTYIGQEILARAISDAGEFTSMARAAFRE